MGLLAGKVCIVTGAGQGLGRAIALEMSREGAILALVERNRRRWRKPQPHRAQRRHLLRNMPST